MDGGDEFLDLLRPRPSPVPDPPKGRAPAETRALMIERSADLAELLEVAPAPILELPRIVPDVGVHYGVRDEVYHRSWDAVSNSRLSVLYDQTPAHLFEIMRHPPADTPSTVFGRAVHTAILEPDNFKSYAKWTGGPRRSNKAKEAFAELEAEYGVGRVLTPEVYDDVVAVRDSVRSRPTVMDLLVGPGHHSEMSIVWRDELTQLLCKARPDHLCPDLDEGLAVIDVKSTEDASRDAFSASIFKYGYHRQAALYLEGLAAHGFDARHWVFIAVEKNPPFEVAIWRLRSSALAAGRGQLDGLLRKYRKCLDAGMWPGYPHSVEEIDLPFWAHNRIEQEIKGAS